MSQYASAQTFAIGESAAVLRAQLDFSQGQITQQALDQIIFVEACKNPSARLQDRNRPYLSVWNTSNTQGAITSILINMEEAGFEFGNGDVAGDGFAGFLSMLSGQSDNGVTLDSAVFGADTSELQLNFSGLGQGQAAIFRVDIDEPGGVFMFPDFRDAFQGANQGFGRNGDRAILTTAFANGPDTSVMFRQLGRLEGFGRPEGYQHQTMPMPEIATVPEPSSLLLLLAGFTGIAAMRRKR